MISVNKEGLKNGFQEFLRPDMKIVMHSSLRSFGYVEGGASTVIRVLMEIISPSGLIMMPTFTYGKEPYDALETSSHTGRIAEVFRLSAGVVRSLHPTHSFSAWGNGAQAILDGHKVIEPFKRGTPLEKFSRQGGYVILAGVTHVANSLIHVAQELAEVPYLDRSKTVKIKIDGRLEEVTARRAGCSLGFDKISVFLEEDGLVMKYKVGGSQILFMKAEDVLNKAIEVLENNPYILSCDNPDCFACNEMKSFIKK